MLGWEICGVLENEIFNVFASGGGVDECGQDFNFGLKIGDAGNAGSVSPPVDLAF